MHRREVLRIGGVSMSLAAITAACGTGRGGDDAPGRVGLAPPATDLPNYDVDDAVLLRTAASLERTAVDVYATARDAELLGDVPTALVDRLVAGHERVAARMDDLTVIAGGTPWLEANPWIVERAIEPILATILDSDDPPRDAVNFAIALENLASSTHQSLARSLSTADQRRSVIDAATLEARHAAALVIATRGADGYLSPALLGEDEARDENNLPPQYAIRSAFGTVSAIELIVGPADENGIRTTFSLATPADNAYIYNELG